MSTNNEPQHGSWPVLLRAGATTAFLLALLAAFRWVPLPGVTIEDVSSFIPIRTSLAILGISPLLNGFILVELLSFTPPGRRVRRGGLARPARPAWAGPLPGPRGAGAPGAGGVGVLEA